METKISKNMIDDIIKHLVHAYKPLEIYLFGSYAWGNPTKDSDIDFFIIIEDSDVDAAERIRIGLRELKDIKVDVDILVYTRLELASRSPHKSTLAYKVLHKGVKLYEAA